MRYRILLCPQPLTCGERAQIVAQIGRGIRAWPAALSAEWGISLDLAAGLIRTSQRSSNTTTLKKVRQ